MKTPFSKINVWHVVASAFVFSMGVVCGAETDATTESEDWWKTQQTVTDQLLRERKDLVTLAQEANRSTPAKAGEAMRKLNVLLRAGLWAEAIHAADQLHEISPGLAEHAVRSIYYSAWDELEAGDVAQRVVELYANNLSELPLENRLLKHFTTAGWSVDAIDKWLAARPPGRDGFWMKARLSFNATHGRADKLIEKLSAEVRANPGNIAAAIQYLDAVLHAGIEPQKRPDLSWYAGTIRPERPTDAVELAQRMQNLREWVAAAEFYRSALKVPLSREELREIQSTMQAVVSDDYVASSFTVRAKEGLSACLLELGGKAEAQRLMEEAAALRKDRGLGGNLQFAGQTQLATGARVIESAIIEEEKKSKDDPRYWLERAGYFGGRQEAAAEEEALRKALALTPPAARPDRPGKGFQDWRSHVISSLDGFLTRHQREDEAVAMLVKELKDSPAESVSSERAARIIAFDHQVRIDPDENSYWLWLGNRPEWSHTEERLLWNLLRRAAPAKLDSYVVRAEKLSAGADPTRNKTLGWILNRMDQAARSIPLLQDAVARLPDKELRDSAFFTLFESYLDTRDWPRAEAAFPDAARRLTSHEMPKWQSRIAVLAARAGAKDDAMRLWKSVVNVNACCFDSLDDLAGAGLASELRAFYAEFGQRLPTSVVPARGLKIISAREVR